MINYIRTLVSGNKCRFIDREYDLDLSYITPRILAMAFPGSGIETLYRNPIDTVVKFLKERHGTNFKLLNLSGKTIAKDKFPVEIENYEWVDHHAPPMKLLFEICDNIHRYLKENNDNVIVINCRAGKGRTGTVICCYLLYTRRFTDPEDCFNYYSKKRFKKGNGVTQPSQKKYVIYFSQLLQMKKYEPVKWKLTSITINNLFKSHSVKSVPIYFSTYPKNLNVCDRTTKKSFSSQEYLEVKDDKVEILNEQFFVSGDITIKIYKRGYLSDSTIGRISFNTGLDEKKQVLIFPLEQIDPDNLKRNKRIPRDFSITVTFSRQREVDEDDDVKFINNILELYEKEERREREEMRESYSMAKLLLFGKDDWDDVNMVLGKKINEKELEQVPEEDFENYGDFKENEDEKKKEDDIENENENDYKKEKDDMNDEFNSSFEGECKII